MNLPVWKRLNRFVRTKDIRISNIQRICVAAEAALAGVLHSLVTQASVQTKPLIRCLFRFRPSLATENETIYLQLHSVNPEYVVPQKLYYNVQNGLLIYVINS